MTVDYNETLKQFQRVAAPAECTGEEFLRVYVKWMHRRAWVRGNREYIRIAKWVEAHWDNQVKHVYRLFPMRLMKQQEKP